jgi:hypothetical protein
LLLPATAAKEHGQNANRSMLACCDVDKMVKLFAITDGRDKIGKTLGGVAKLFAYTSLLNGDAAKAKKFGTLAKSIGESRSLLRMGKFVGNYQKLQGFAAKAGDLKARQIVEVLRVIGDFGYVLGDNLTYLGKYGVLPTDPKKCTKNGKLFQFWGFVCAVALDVWAIALLQGKKLEKSLYAKELKALLLSLVKNTADMLVCLQVVGYVKSYKPSGGFTAVCAITSGSIATYTNWNKLK